MPLAIQSSSAVLLSAVALVSCFPTVPAPATTTRAGHDDGRAADAPIAAPPEGKAEEERRADDRAVVRLGELLRDPDALYTHLDHARHACGAGTVSRAMGARGVQFRFPRWCAVEPLGRVRGAGRVERVDEPDGPVTLVTLDGFDIDDGPQLDGVKLRINGHQASWTYAGAIAFKVEPGQPPAVVRADPEIADTFAARFVARTALGLAVGFGKPLLAVAGPLMVATAKAGAYAGTAAGIAVISAVSAATHHR